MYILLNTLAVHVATVTVGISATLQLMEETYV